MPYGLTLSIVKELRYTSTFLLAIDKYYINALVYEPTYSIS